MSFQRRGRYLTATAGESPDSAPLKRVQNPGRLIAFGVVTAVLVGAAFVVGGMVKSPQDQALANVDSEVEVFAQVEERVVSDSFSLPAVVVAGATTDVLVTEAPREASPVAPPAATDTAAPPAATPVAPTENETAVSDRAVVSRMAVAAGDTLKYGSLIGEVSGRPVFAWPSSVPLFRDIVVGARGSDVKAVQQSLADMGYSVTVDGVFGAGSLATLQLLYREAGYELPFVASGVRGLSWRELIGVPTGDGVVQAAAPVGSLLGAEAPLMTIRTTPPALEAQATAVEVGRLAAGAEVGVEVAGAAPVLSTVVALGAFATNEDTGASGYPVRIALPADVAIDASTPVQIRPWGEPQPSLAVPTSAIRQEGSASFVLVRGKKAAEGEAPAHERIDIAVVAQADGWVSIEANDALPVGTEILVSP